MTHHATQALRAVLIAAATWALCTVASAPSSAAVESSDTAAASVSTDSSLLGISGLVLMGTGIVLVAISLIIRKRSLQ